LAGRQWGQRTLPAARQGRIPANGLAQRERGIDRLNCRAAGEQFDELPARQSGAREHVDGGLADARRNERLRPDTLPGERQQRRHGGPTPGSGPNVREAN
jgi:hypothetical protein